MSEENRLETAVRKDAELEIDDERDSPPVALDDEQFPQIAVLDDEQFPQNAALDDERPTGRSDAKDPWHGLNDFDEE